jgi:aminopeptidase N
MFKISAFVLCSALCAHTAFAQTYDPCMDPAGGCGKAHAAVLQDPDVMRESLEDSGTREAMPDTDVLHYKLDIELSGINTAGNSCTITGSNVMTIQNKSAALTEFTFRLRTQYTITSALINGTIPVSVATLSTTTRKATLDRTYLMDEIFTLTINYTGTSLSAGFGSFDVAAQSSGSTAVVASLSEAWYAYTWWPSKDGDTAQPGDNSDKATFEISVTAPNNWVVPSNGLLLGVDTLSGNRKRYNWATNYQMTAYLLSLAATNYNAWAQTYTFPAGPYNPAGTMQVQFYIYPGSDTPGHRTAWENCLNMLTTYRGIYGEYPFVNEKYGIYQFNFGGGQEHQTMTGEGTFDEGVTAHELGHQWWGDMITCKTWSDISVNEGFATYTECLWEERKGGGINTTAYFARLNFRRPSSNGAGDSVYIQPSVITSMTATNGMNRIFSQDYTYNKGAWVLHMLRHIVGDAMFFNILAEYRNSFQYSAATWDDFAAIAEGTSGVELTPFFNEFVYNKGAPAYNYGWQSVNVNGQNYLLTKIDQTQTATAGSPPQTLSVYQMPVDLSATISGSPQTLKVQDTARNQWFVVPVSGTVTALAFDPAPYILRGAATSIAYAAGPPKIVSTTPALGSTLLTGPSQLSIWFHTNVNAAAGDFSVVGTSTGAHSFTLISGANVNPVVLDFGGPLPSDTYTVTVQDSVVAVNSGMGLDGEIANATNPASLPSGDGLAGGDATFSFNVVPCIVAGDIDVDCDVDDTDVDLFVQVLLGNDINGDHITRSDMDGNLTPDGADIPLFIAAYLNP